MTRSDHKKNNQSLMSNYNKKGIQLKKQKELQKLVKEKVQEKDVLAADQIIMLLRNEFANLILVQSQLIIFHIYFHF